MSVRDASVRTTPVRPISRGRDSATGPTPSTVAVSIETVSAEFSSLPIAWTIRTRPPAIPYQVAPLPSMIR